MKEFLLSLSNNKALGTSRLTPAYYKEILEYSGNLIKPAINKCLLNKLSLGSDQPQFGLG